MSKIQANRPIQLSTPLGDDVLLFHSMTGRDLLGGLFEYEVEMVSEETNVEFNQLLGETMTIKLELPDDGVRYFNGHVSRFSHAGSVGRLERYRATLVPWFWLLTRTADCRIFQEMSVPEIIKQVFREKGFTDFDDALGGSYRPWEYCVQYRESDFNFISRMMEQEGIYYFFEHDDGKHRLILADSISSHERFAGYEQIPFYPPDADIRRERDHIHEWSMIQEVQSGEYTLTDYDFQKPKTSLLAKAQIQRDHTAADYRVFDYPGEYVEPGDGEHYARTRIEELHARFQTFTGQANARGLSSGALFELTNFPRSQLNKEYLVVSADYELRTSEYESGSNLGSEDVFLCSVRSIASTEVYRPPQQTPKPLIRGPQTAVVVGKDGEEIWTDKHGRVKLQFHWDRYGESNEESSCWVRVSQPWAGTNWGGVFLPRIGQEVIVEFLEGDPDRPIITGRVYNGDNLHPYALPDNQTQSGFKSRSSKEGSGDNFNEIRFEDKKGEEQVYIHAEKNEDIVVENDKTEDVGHDETITIGNDRTETVDHNETLTVQNDRTRTVNNNEAVTVAKLRTHTVGINEAITVGAAQEVTVGGFRTMTVGLYQNTAIGLDHSESIGKNHSVDVGDDETVKIGKKLLIDAGDEILIKTGKASILMKSDGTINIEGKDITVKGSGQITQKASKDIVMKGKKILEN